MLDSTVSSHYKELDFLLFGAIKAGTTSLFHYLRYHPQLYLPAGKELPFFNKPSFSSGWDAFACQYFANADDNLLWGKITPSYMPYPNVPERIYRLMPNVKLIALLRNPTARAYSHYLMEVRTGRVQKSFDELIKDELKNTRTQSTYLLAHGNYGANIERYLQEFPREQMLILLTDDLERQPQMVLDTILEFLGLSSGYSPHNLDKKYHQGGTSRHTILKDSIRRNKPLIWFLQRLPEEKKSALKFWYNTQFSIKRAAKPELDAEPHQRLVDYYQDDVAKLQSLTGCSIPWPEFLST